MLQPILIILGLLTLIVGLVSITSCIATILFNKEVNREIRKLYQNNTGNQKQVITGSDLEGLPLCVQKWLEHAGVIGKESIRTVRLKQKGAMRIKEGGPWLPCEAEQYFTIDEPGFIWKVKVKMAPFLFFTGRDKYYEGKGNMLIKILALVTVVSTKGQELDQGTLLRYLAETQWFPTAALSRFIQWQEIDPHSARATMSYKGVTASGVFEFNEKGEVINFTAKRYMEKHGNYSLETWSGNTKGYRTFNNVDIPNKGEVIWKLKTGDFDWYRWEITEVEYDKPAVY